MRIACVGGGPAGLYFSLLMKLWKPESDVTVFERNKEGVTHGWGVVIEAKFLAMLAESALDRLEDIFAGHMDGHPLIARFPDGIDAHWLNFPALDIRTLARR